MPVPLINCIGDRNIYAQNANKEIIYTKRGLGYFVSVGAKTAILQMKREEFMNETLPDVARQMANLNISMDELTKGIISFQMRNDN